MFKKIAVVLIIVVSLYALYLLSDRKNDKKPSAVLDVVSLKDGDLKENLRQKDMQSYILTDYIPYWKSGDKGLSMNWDIRPRLASQVEVEEPSLDGDRYYWRRQYSYPLENGPYYPSKELLVKI